MDDFYPLDPFSVMDYYIKQGRRNMKFAQLNGLQISEDQVKDLQKQIENQKLNGSSLGNGSHATTGKDQFGNIVIDLWGTEATEGGVLLDRSETRVLISRLQDALNGKFYNE